MQEADIASEASDSIEHAQVVPNIQSTAVDMPMAPQLRKQPPRLFLDLFAGAHSPLTGIDRDAFAPFDFALRETHDILDDRVMHLLQRLAFSGLIGVAWSAPPCKNFLG